MRAQISADYNRLLEICNNSLAKNNTNWIAYHFRGNAYYLLEKYQDAENDLKNSIQLNKTEIFLAEDYNTLGIICRRSKRYALARQCYMKAIEINKEFASCYCNIAVLLTDDYDPQKGPDNKLIEFFYTKSIEIDPYGCAFAYKELANKAMEAGNIENVIKLLTTSIEIERATDELLSINEYNNRGQAYLELKNYSKAIEDFKYCTKLNPYDAESFAYIGYCYALQKNLTDACANLSKAKELSERVGTRSEKIRSMIKDMINEYCK